MESAWNEPHEWRKFLEDCFPGIKIYYMCEEEGMGICETNDKRGTYFPHYILYVDNEDTDYFWSLNELISEVERITGTKEIQNIKDCNEALETAVLNGNIQYYNLYQTHYIQD